MEKEEEEGKKERERVTKVTEGGGYICASKNW